MPRTVAIVLIVAYFFTAVPVWARRQTQAAEPAALDAGPTPNDACDLVNPFRGIHAVVIDLAEKAHDAGQYSLNLHRTSRWVGYKHVEVEVRDLEGVSKTTFRAIASLSFSLDTLPDNDAKLAAVTLASTYQNAVSQIDDYAHAAVDYERTENSFSKLRMTTTLTYSIPEYWKLRTYWDNIMRHHLDERYTEIGDALRSLEIPEHLYAKNCAPARFAAHVPATTTIENPCELADRLADLRTTITRMGEKAVDAGHVSRALHLTSRWRPYKRAENDWIALTDKVNPTLDELANLALRINDSPDSNKKDATLNLIANYQNAVEQFVDYAHFATYYERNENEAGTNSYGFRLAGPRLAYSRDTEGGLGLGGGVLGMPNAPLGSYEPDTRALLDFGTVRDNTKANMVTSALNLFEAKYTEADDAFRNFKLPEYRFSKACRTTPPRISIPYAADPCRVSKDILGIRVSVTRLGEEVRDMDRTARALHRTTRSRPLRYIEKKWSDVMTRSSPLLDELSELLVALDAAPEGEKKKAATDLTTAYQSAVENFIDSGHLAVYYERAENLLGARFYSDNGTINFGIPINVVRNNADLVARDYLEGKILQANNASRSLKLPEYRYGKLCKIAVAPIKVREAGKR